MTSYWQVNLKSFISDWQLVMPPFIYPWCFRYMKIQLMVFTNILNYQYIIKWKVKGAYIGHGKQQRQNYYWIWYWIFNGSIILTERQINPNSFRNFWEDAPKMNSYSIHAVQKLLMRKSMFNLVKINKTKCDATIHTRLQFHTERKLQEPSIIMWPLWANIFVLILIKEIY